LPPILLDSDSNMMYFKHFLGHTARLLVPHDCSENPFKMVLPQNAAREIILSRGETEGIHCRDNVSYFLVRWFAYLDVVGSLSGRDNDKPPLFSGKYWISENDDENEDSAVDCVLGFTSKCVSILAKIGELARRSDQEKKKYYDDHIAAGVKEGQEQVQGIVKNWKPPQDIEDQARKLEHELGHARSQREIAGAQFSCRMHHGRNHDTNLMSNQEVDNKEMLATNDAFHSAALVHLYRRVLNYPSEHPKVQRAVAAIIGDMHKVRHNGDAENCLLFPLFTAGCEAIKEVHRSYTLKRMQAVEKIGMTQVTAARRLMQRVWEEGVPWETLSDGEFIG